MYIKWLYTLISALTFRIRGGLRIYKDKKFPLNKFWFAVWFPTMNCLLRGWNPAFFVTGLIASKLCTSIAGWGSYIGALFSGKISENDKDDLNITDFVQTKLFPSLNKAAEFCSKYKFLRKIPVWFPFMTKTYDQAPRMYGWFTLSLRGGLTTFILGLWLNSIWYMPVGLLQGTVYWLGHLTCKYIWDDGKSGWKISEWYWGFVLGLAAVLVAPLKI